MRFVVLAVFFLFGAGCISPIIPIGDGKTAKQAQRQTLNDMGPARLTTGERWSGEVATRTVRVWADGQYRSQNVDWRHTFDETLEIANLVLSSQFGVTLVADYRVWDRNVPGSTLADDANALVAQDPGADAFAVIGLTSSLPLVSATFDQLGLANLGGRHLVVRGYADIEERKMYADAFRDLLPEERELALVQRRQHKTAVVVLHELAHVFGVEHDEREDLITSASYSHRAQAFSARGKDTMLHAINVRLGRDEDKPVTYMPEPKPAKASEPIMLYITAGGDVMYRSGALDDAALEELLVRTAERDKRTELKIMRAKKAPSAALQRVMARASALGLTHVSIALY